MIRDSCVTRGGRRSHTVGVNREKDFFMEGVVAQNPMQSVVAQERTYTQAELNDISSKIREEAYRKAQRMLIEQPDYLASKYEGAHTSQNSIKSEDVTKLIDEKLKAQQEKIQQDYLQQHYYAKAQDIAQKFEVKSQIGAKKYADFNEIVSKEIISDFPTVLSTVMESVDNPEDVLYELAKDPMRMAQMENTTCASPIGYKTGLSTIKKISENLKKRPVEDAMDENVPVSSFVRKLTSSAEAKTGKSEPSVEDFKKMYKW